MSEQANHPPAAFYLWLAKHTGFPALRLGERAEQLLLLGGLTQDEHLPRRSVEGALFTPGVPDVEGAQRSSQRTLAELRRRVHFKCDNSAKV